MKKFLRFIGVLLLVIVAGFLILCFIAPKETVLNRSIVINAPKEVVWDQMVKFKNWSNWSPWQEKDSTIVVTLTGDEGKPGSSYSWTSKNSGSGTITNMGIEGSKMMFRMHFKEPFEAEPDGYVMVGDAGSGTTKATWGFHGENNFISGGMMKMMELFGMGLTKDYDRGLQLLKNYSEKHAKDLPASDVSISQTQFPGHTYAAIRKTMSTDENTMMKFFEQSYKALGSNAGKHIVGPASCLAYKWDEKNQSADLAAAFPVSGTDVVKDASMVTVAPSKAYMTVLNGDYKGMEKAHGALSQYVAAKNLQPKLVIEEYIKGPGDEKDPSKWVTNIYYLVD